MPNQINDEEDIKILSALAKDVEELLTTKYKDVQITWLLAAGRPGVNSFSGNACALCIGNALAEWIFQNNLEHSEAQAAEIPKEKLN